MSVSNKKNYREEIDKKFFKKNKEPNIFLKINQEIIL